MTYCHTTAQLNQYLREQDAQEVYEDALDGIMLHYDCSYEEAVKLYQEVVSEAAWERNNDYF